MAIRRVEQGIQKLVVTGGVSFPLDRGSQVVCSQILSCHFPGCLTVLPFIVSHAIAFLWKVVSQGSRGGHLVSCHCPGRHLTPTESPCLFLSPEFLLTYAAHLREMGKEATVSFSS